MASQAELLIRPHGRATPARRRVLEVLLGAAHAMSHAEIEAELETDVCPDRVTLYRVLDWLVSKRLAHKIAGDDRAWRFNAVAADGHGHAHFHCTRCGQVYCLSELQPAFAFSLPPGYRFDSAELTIQGLCPRCSEAA
ncbi:transcriptional repressor [Parasulfuritortus cantonensis]|uniref:Transcriptional repressor n=1 Tax=Parasulfuritortus cantonensis TaxID=2528202 RepID=A0A4R1BEF9_9PROT|nr:transcriptional repressor [Parasulfuritortus cantonensis]TCJ15499.1 transcriptional repressor [Parasulfuritortus cantonensis]